MSPNDFKDDLAEWELRSGGTLSNDIEVWLERYVADKNAKGISLKTVKSYREAVQPFIEYCSIYEAIMDIDTISAKFINNYLIWYQNKLSQNDFGKNRISLDDYKKVKLNETSNKGRNDAKFEVLFQYQKSLSHRVTVLKQLLLFISENNKEQKDFTSLFKSITKIKVQKRSTDYLTSQELEEMIAMAKDWPKIYRDYKSKSSERLAWRNGLLVLLYALTGARADEVVSLKLGHIVDSSFKDESGKVHTFYMIQYHTTKGDKYREIAVHKNEIKAFVDYMRSELPGENYYISSTYKKEAYTNKKMADSEVYRFVTWMLESMGIKKSGRHIIRRGYATKELSDGKDLSIVALELGHTSTNTTFHGYIKNNPELMMKNRLLGSDFKQMKFRSGSVRNFVSVR